MIYSVKMRIDTANRRTMGRAADQRWRSRTIDRDQGEVQLFFCSHVDPSIHPGGRTWSNQQRSILNGKCANIADCCRVNASVERPCQGLSWTQVRVKVS